MRVGFYLDSADERYERMLDLASAAVLAAMPFAAITRLSHSEGAEYTIRRVRAQAAVEQPTLFIDVDCIVRRDVSDVWRHEFDIALPEVADPFVRYSGAVVFSRSAAFWRNWAEHAIWAHRHDVRELLQAFTGYVDGFAGKVLRLPQWKYEALPKNGSDACPGASIVHYRGPRKDWIPGL